MKTTLSFLSLLLAGSTAAFAQYTNRSSVLDGSGARSAGGIYTNLSAAGQPGGIAVAGGGTWVNQAGFLNTFFLKPALDHDHDGLPDEADLDNDADGLADTAEIGGGSFNPTTPTDPNLADSDGDGAWDRAEAAAGTNPQDPEARLEWVRIRRGVEVDVAWQARSNKTYRVLYALTAVQPATNLLAIVTATNSAAPPWYALTNWLTDPTTTPLRVYAVEVAP